MKATQNSGTFLQWQDKSETYHQCNVSGVFSSSTSYLTPKKSRKKKEQKGYFTSVEEQKICDYKESSSFFRKNLIFEELYPKFEYLIISLIYNFNIPKHFDDVDHIKQDCMCVIYEGIDKYDPKKISPKTGKTSKFFSYCSVMVSNHLRQIIKKKKNKIRFENDLCIDYIVNNLDTHGTTKFSIPINEEDLFLSEIEQEYMIKEFFAALIQEMPKWKQELSKENDLAVMDAIIVIFSDAEKLDSLGKKEIFWIIKDITGLKPQSINGSLKNIKKLFRKYKRKYNGD